ncbi:MAG: hypothetical protein IAF94_15520 [Pirellulaceae bacterium]|nr:hypothetical protein [Pirellulaceae bacterium]
MNGTPKSNAAFSPLRQGWLVVGIAGAIAIGNMVMSILCQQNNFLARLAVPWYGTLVAQMGLLCTWSVFANIAGWRRVVGILGLSALIFGPLVIGYVVAFRDREFPTLLRISAGFVLLILIITTTTQLPLWILKIFFGWRIGNERTQPSDRRRQFSIRHLLVLTAVIGLLIVATQTMIGLLRVRGWVVLPGVAAIMLLPGIGMLISVVPALVVILRVRQPLWRGWNIFWTAILSFIGLAGLVTGAEGSVGVIFLVVGLPIGLSLPLALARREGYRLMTGWDAETKVLST